jgi:hypothetical protein
LVGNTYGTNGAPLAGVTIRSASQAVSSTVTADPVTPDSFYNLFLPVGTHGVTATAPGLPASTATITMSDKVVLRQDFNWKVVFTDASLRALATMIGQLVPLFSPGVLDYSLAVGHDVSSLGVSFAANQPGAAIRFNGIALPSGVTMASAELQPGVNVVTIEVTALDGKSTQTYTITVTRAMASDTLYLPDVRKP